MTRKLLHKPDQLNVAMIVPHTEAEGPGRRFALWVQGCPMRCPGCCNQEMLEFVDKTWRDVDDVLADVLKAKEKHQIEGVTFLGGEPFSQPEALSKLARKVRLEGLTVMIFTGFTRKTLLKSKRPGVAELLAETDLLVDGQFQEENIDSKRRWIGSNNQETYALTDAYKALVEDWDTTPETLEVRVINGKLVVNGSPFLLNAFNKL